MGIWRDFLRFFGLDRQPPEEAMRNDYPDRQPLVEITPRPYGAAVPPSADPLTGVNARETTFVGTEPTESDLGLHSRMAGPLYGDENEYAEGG